MTLTAVPITPDNRDKFADLRVNDAQQHLIATNEYWLDQAARVEVSKTFGLVKDGISVGLFSLIDPRLVPADDADLRNAQPGCGYLWRFMVDSKAQGAGVGRQALALIEDYVRDIGLKGLSMTTMDTEKGNALPFYLAQGYVATGRRLGGEIELIKLFPEIAHA
ncbi:MAG: GNAT family N-acetyltransferase [Sulfitobacter sp.]